MSDQSIGFVGAGQMAQALARGFVAAGLFAADKVWASDPSSDARKGFEELVSGAHVTDANRDVAKNAKILVLAVKPQLMDDVLAGIAADVDADHLVISIAAGVRIAQLARVLGDDRRLVRVMPNTPCLVGQSASAYCLGSCATVEDGESVDRLMSAVGRALQVDEKLLDAVTGLSGSGPAFVCVLIEALSDGGVHMGLPREVASALATQTVRGTAELIQGTGQHPAVLKDRVASPGGTTIAGLEALEMHGFRAAILAAVEAATLRSIELGGD